ncbi:MAG: ddpC 6 [Hyphomicrobiales bacterium]|nr:ddpC 6 [Hyphomicrobiales bacterium]
MTSVPSSTPDQQTLKVKATPVLTLLYHDKLAFVSAIFLVIVILCALLGGPLFSGPANAMNLGLRRAPPFTMQHGFLYILGGDTLGRSIFARIIVASQDTLAVSAGAVFCSVIVGTLLGLIAGLKDGWIGTLIMRCADVVMSFPSLLLALIILYILGPSVPNVIIVLAITRVPVYLRTVRAEVLEIRQRMFVLAARSMAANSLQVVSKHILPVVRPTLITLAMLDFAFIMLTESSLTFLGLGIQPPDITWGLMVSQGQNYLVAAWWISFWPGAAIMLTTISLCLLGNWVRVASDPRHRWRLE